MRRKAGPPLSRDRYGFTWAERALWFAGKYTRHDPEFIAKVQEALNKQDAAAKLPKRRTRT